MKPHRNAKTNVYQRQLLITRVRRLGWTQRQAAEAAGVSVRTVAKWLARARTSLSDGSSRPHRQPRRLAAPTEAAVVALRRTRATAWQISVALRLPRSTVTRVLARAGLNRLAWLEIPAPVHRYEWPHVGDLLHLDLKRLGPCAALAIASTGRRRRARRVGLKYLHAARMPRGSPMPTVLVQTPPRRACAAFLRAHVALRLAASPSDASSR